MKEDTGYLIILHLIIMRQKNVPQRMSGTKTFTRGYLKDLSLISVGFLKDV